MIAEFAALKAAEALVDHYRRSGDDAGEARHDARALAIRTMLVAELGRRSGLDATALRELLG